MGVSSRARGTGPAADIRYPSCELARLVGSTRPPDLRHPSLSRYLARRAESLGNGLRLEVDGRRLPLQAESSAVILPPGGRRRASDAQARHRLPGEAGWRDGLRAHRLRHRDDSFPERAGWKEIVAVAGPP